MATVSHYEMHLGNNSYYVASNPQLSPMYDKTKKSWSQRLKITKTEKLVSPIVPVTPTQQHINEFATFEYGPSGALSRSMKYAEPWLYSTVRGIPAARPSLHYHHNGHPAIFAPFQADLAVVICSCPEYLTGTKRDVKKASICKKCKGSRLPLAPIGGTVRLRPTSAPIMHQQRISAATLRLPSTTKSRPSILDAQNDPYDMMRRTRLLSPDPPRESFKVSNSRHSEKNSSSSSKNNQSGSMSKNGTANRGRTRYRASTGTSITSTTTNISVASINSNANGINEHELIAITKTATIRSRSASKVKTQPSQKALRDRWSDAGADMQIDPGGRRSILECNVNPYELISCGTMNANNEFSPPDTDDMFDIPIMRNKTSSSDAVAISAAAAAALIKEQKNYSNNGKKLGYTNVQNIAGQRIVLGEQKLKSKLVKQNGENFLYEDIEVQAQITTTGSNKIIIDNIMQQDKAKQSTVSFSSDNDDDLSTIEFMADGQTKYHPKRPPRKKNEIVTTSSVDEEIDSSHKAINSKNSFSSSEISPQVELENFLEKPSPSTPTTPTTPTIQKQQTIKSILKRPSSVSSSLSTTSSISDNDAKNNQNVTSNFKSYINQSSLQSDSITTIDSNTQIISNSTVLGTSTAKKLLATGNTSKKVTKNNQTLNNQKNEKNSISSSNSTKENHDATMMNFNCTTDPKNNSLNVGGIGCNNTNNSIGNNNKRNSAGSVGGSQFYLPMPSVVQPSRKKVQFMVEDKIIKDDDDDDDDDQQENSNCKDLPNKNDARNLQKNYCNSIDNNNENDDNDDDDKNNDNNKENRKIYDYTKERGHKINEDEFLNVENSIINIYNDNDYNHKIVVNNNANNKKQNFFNNGSMNITMNNGIPFNTSNDIDNYNNDDDEDNKNCQQLMLMLEQQKVQSEILDLLQKQTNNLLKSSKDSNSVNGYTNNSSVNSNYTQNNSENQSNQSNTPPISMKIILGTKNSFADSDTVQDNKLSSTSTSSSIKSDKPQMNLSNMTALRRTHSDRRTHITTNTTDSNQKIKLQFNDTMALRLKINRTAATQDLFIQQQQQNDNFVQTVQQYQQNTFYRPKEPPPPPPQSSAAAAAVATQSSTTIIENFPTTKSVQKSNKISSTPTSSSSSFVYDYENKTKNVDEAFLLLLPEMHSNENIKTSSKPSESSESTTLIKATTDVKNNNNRNAFKRNNDLNNSNSSIKRNQNNVNNSKRNMEKIKTATKSPEPDNQSTPQSIIVSQSQSKGLQQQQQNYQKQQQQQHQQQIKSSLSSQQRRQSTENLQNGQHHENKSKIIKTLSKENLKSQTTTTTKTKRVSWGSSSETNEDYSIVKQLKSSEDIKELKPDDEMMHSQNKSTCVNNVSLKTVLLSDDNYKMTKASNESAKETIKCMQQEEQISHKRPARPTTLPITNKAKSLTEEQKLIIAQNEIITAARLFGNTNKLILNSATSPSTHTTTTPPPLYQQTHQQQQQRTVVRVAPFNTTITTPTPTDKSPGEIHRLKIKHTDDTCHNGFSNGFNNENNGISNTNNDQKKTSILINGDDCYSTVNVTNDTPIYQASVVVTDGTSPISTLSSATKHSTSNDNNNISKYYPSNTVTINVNSSKENDISSTNKGIDSTTTQINNKQKSLEDDVIYKNNKLNMLLSMNGKKSIIPINATEIKNDANANINHTIDETFDDENHDTESLLKVRGGSKRGRGTFIKLEYDKNLSSPHSGPSSLEFDIDENQNNTVSNSGVPHEDELVKILRNPVEAIKRNLIPHVCGKSENFNLFQNGMDDTSSTISTTSRTSSTSTLATVLDDPLLLRNLNKKDDFLSDSKDFDNVHRSGNSLRTDKNSLVSKLLEDPTLSHLADGLESDVIVRLIESSLKRLKENRNSIDTSGTKDNDDMTKLIDISLHKIKEERHKLETAQQYQQQQQQFSNKSGIDDQQESQSNRGSISSGNSYTSANYELFEFDTNNESDCYQSCSSEITNCDEEATSTQSKFYQMLVDATLSEIEISANNDDEHHYESIRLNGDPIYEEISEIPPPLPLSPPPVNENDFERKSSKSMFEGASKYDILSYLVDAKERGIVKEDNFDFNFTNGINDIILEEEKTNTETNISNNCSTSLVGKELRNSKINSQINSDTTNSINSNNNSNISNNKINSIKNKNINNNNGDIKNRINSQLLATTPESCEDTQSMSSSINEKLLTPNNSATNTLSSNGSIRCKHSSSTSIDIERNDSGVGSETSKSSRSKYQQQNPPAASCLLDKNSPIHLCEDCDGPVETQITDSGVMYAPLVCRKCGKKRAERKEIITEIVETEEKYGRDLQIILEEFCQPMLVAGLLTQEQLSAIFLNTEELLENNQTLAERMRDALDIALEQGDDDLLTVNIGKIFLESTQMLHAFESYCVRQAAASLLLANLEKEKELLRIFLRVSQMENTVLRRMNLNSFLMVPVQRVTKYPLLLARLYKVTPNHLDGKELLKQAQEKIELHLNHMNQEAKDVPTKLWRRISSSSPNRRASCEIDMINIKLRKMAIDVLEWNHDEVRFTMEGKLLFTQPTDSNWKKGRTIKLTPVNALLVTNGKPSTNYKSDKAYADQLHFPKHTGIREASLLLVKEKCGRYTLIREPLYMDRCIICTEADWDDYFEVHEISSKDTFIFKAEDGIRTKHWYKQLQYHSQGMGAWRKRRNALANIMINGMLSRS